VGREEVEAVTERLERAAAIGAVEGAAPDDDDGPTGTRRSPAGDGSVGTLFHDGMERFAAHYDPDLGSLADYLPEDMIVVRDDPGKLRQRAEDLERTIERGFHEWRAHYPPSSGPEGLFLPPRSLDGIAARHTGVDRVGPGGGHWEW